MKIDFSGFDKFRDKFDLKDEHLLALKWMLESIFNYQEDLGLTTRKSAKEFARQEDTLR